MTITAKSIGQGRATLASEVRSEIERMILQGDLAAGEKLNELTLSNAMGVSRGTVREAIRSLADSGLINLITNRGAFVHEITRGEVRNLYDLRKAIFAMACASAARRVSEGSEKNLIRNLAGKMDRMHKAHRENDKKKYYALNIEFHDLLMEAAGNPKAKVIYDNLVREMHLFRQRGLSIATNIARSLDEHQAITAAVTKGNPEAAHRAAETHLDSGLGRYMQILEQDADDAT